MDTIKIEQFPGSDPSAEQRENLLFLLGRMRQIQAASDLHRVPSLAPGHSLFKRSASDDQPLDFSAPAKHPRLSPDWLVSAPDNKYDSLASDGHSDVSSHSPRSTSGGSDSGRDTTDTSRDPRPGSTSPPRPELPSLSIPSPDTTDSSYNKSDLLTTAPGNKFPLLKPLSSLQEDVKPVIDTEEKPQLPPVSLPLPFSGFPVFPQPLKPSFPASLPFPFPPSTTPATPAAEMSKISVDSQEKYAEFREKMMKNMEVTRSKVKRVADTSSEDSNVSLEMTPQHHSTPTRDGKDAAYWERRRKNNEAAKRSRDARRQKENEIAVRASFLEQENIQLKMELVQLRTELGAMRDQINRR